jgi:hypothetical protein
MGTTTFEAGLEDGRRVVAATAFPTRYAHMLVRGLQFTPDPAGGRLVWEYPAGAPGWDDAARNWVELGPEMLDQMHGAAPIDWAGGLRWIAGVLDDLGADWFLIGSAALAVRGMDVRPGGVDVALAEADADRLAPLVAAAVMRPVVDSGGWPVATRWGTLFRRCPIAVIGGMHDQGTPRPWDSAARASLDTVRWDGRELRVPPLRSQLLQARLMFRNDHVRAMLGRGGDEPPGPAESAESAESARPAVPGPADRKPPRLVAGEAETLRAMLQYQRDSLVRKVEGVGDDDARRTLVGSGTTLLWLVKHLARAEQLWVLVRFAGRRPGQDLDERLLDDTVGPDDTLAGAVAAYREAWHRVDAVVDAAPGLDAPCVAMGDDESVNLRWVLAHLLGETARHAGHADVLREQIDGATGR